MYGLSVGSHALQWASSIVIMLLKSKYFGYLAMLAMLTTLASGLALFLVDPNIHSAWDGIWSAWVTMTHVGFGDVVPVSFLGRLLASGLILLGWVYFSLFTALVSVTLLGRNMTEISGSLHHLEQETEGNQSKEEQILQELTRLHARLDELKQTSNTASSKQLFL